jgi:hypothetical protein
LDAHRKQLRLALGANASFDPVPYRKRKVLQGLPFGNKSADSVRAMTRALSIMSSTPTHSSG